MVDVGPIKEQIDEVSKQHKLPAETEKRIKTLFATVKTITQRQANILYQIIDEAKRGFTARLTAEEMSILATVNIFDTPQASEKLAAYKANIGKVFLAGMTLGVLEQRSALVGRLQETAQQSSMNYVKQLGERYRVETSKLVRDAAQKGMPSSDMSKMVQQFFEKKKWEADRIVRTETMRAANTGAYAQARRDGANYYAIDGRAEFCSTCRRISFAGPYPIDDLSHVPPLHPNCACIAVYYRDEAMAAKDQEYLNKQVLKQRAILEKDGFTIPNDGTGKEVNKKPAEDRVKN